MSGTGGQRWSKMEFEKTVIEQYSVLIGQQEIEYNLS